MKDKILLFIIGVLSGAVISTGVFFVYTKASCSCDSKKADIQERGEQKSNNFDMRNNNGGQPPEMSQGDMPANDENSINSNKRGTSDGNSSQNKSKSNKVSS